MAQRALKMSERVARTLRDLAAKMGGGSVEIGFMEGAVYGDGTPVASVAFWNEFGHEGQFPSPPRPFFRTMIAKESPSWPAKMAALLKSTGFDGPRVLTIMGDDISHALEDSIEALTQPELSAVTLMLRKRFGNQPHNIRLGDVFSAINAVKDGKKGAAADSTQGKPLVWTGHMLNSVTFKVMR